MFESHLNLSLAWVQNVNLIKRFLVLQKKPLRITQKKPHTSYLFKHLIVSKLPDQVTLKNHILIFKYFNQSLPKTFKNWSILATVSYKHNASLAQVALKYYLITKLCGRHSVSISAIYT